MEDVNFKAFNVIEGTNESRTLVKYISYECRYEIDG